MVTVTSFGEGTCVWCRKTDEGVQTRFQDGLTGFLCKKDFWQAVKARSESEAEKKKEEKDAPSI